MVHIKVEVTGVEEVLRAIERAGKDAIEEAERSAQQLQPGTRLRVRSLHDTLPQVASRRPASPARLKRVQAAEPEAGDAQPNMPEES